MKDFSVIFVTSTKLADYYAVGAAKLITVSDRVTSGKFLCHTCRVNVCEHTKAVELHITEHGRPREIDEAATQLLTPETQHDRELLTLLSQVEL
jgi:hypothetical protein